VQRSDISTATAAAAFTDWTANLQHQRMKTKYYSDQIYLTKKIKKSCSRSESYRLVPIFPLKVWQKIQGGLASCNLSIKYSLVHLFSSHTAFQLYIVTGHLHTTVANKRKTNKPLKGTKQFLMLTENEHVPALDIDGWRLLLRPSDRTTGVVLFHASRITKSNTELLLF